MKKVCLLMFTVIIIAALGFSSCVTSGITTPDVKQSITIVHTNDHHGHPVAFYNYPAPDQGGLPAQASLMNSIRNMYDDVLVLSAGDINTGRPESNFFKAEPDIIGMNYIRYDALSMGNHEFDPNPEDMQRQIALSNFPWLCANVVDEQGELIKNVKPYIIKDYGEFKVAILGLLDTRTSMTGNPDNIKGYTFKDEVATANEYVPMLKGKADIVIALVHMGLYDDPMMGSKRLAAEVPDLALVIDGHTHTMTEEPVYVTNKVSGKEVPIVQAGQWGLYVGVATLEFLNGEVTDLDYELVPVNVRERVKLDDGSSEYPTVGKEILEDVMLKQLLDPYVARVDAVLDENIGTATAPFLNADTRKMETPIGNLVADSMYWYCDDQSLEVDFAFQNGGGIRTDIPDGTINKRTIYEVLPFDNSIAVVTLSGKDVKALFDRTPETVTHGAMPQVSKEVSFTIDTAAGTASDIMIGGMPLDMNRDYRIATNSYLAAGGDGYEVFKNQIDYYDSSLMQRDALIEYILEKGGSITPKTEGRITIR